MTIRILFIFTALLAAFNLTGCAAKTQHAGTPAALPTTTGAASEGRGSLATSSTVATMGTERVSELPLAAPSKERDDGATRPAATEHQNALAGSGLDTVYFAFDAYLLSAEAREIVTRNASRLTANEALRVTLEGHADERGSDEYNLALAEQRALAVRRYLASLGIHEERLEVVSYGEDKPAVSGSDEAAWARNRRVEFVPVE